MTSIAETLATHSAITGAETRINTMREIYMIQITREPHLSGSGLE